MKFLKEGFDVFVLASFEDKSGLYTPLTPSNEDTIGVVLESLSLHLGFNLDNVFLCNQLGMVLHHFELKCHVRRLVFCLQSRGYIDFYHIY